MEDCVFCKIVKGEIPCTKIYDDDNFIGILNIKPIAEGQALIISKKHFKTLLDVPSSLGNEMLEASKEVALKLIKEGKAEGFNLVVNNFRSAGQVIDHVHVHIIPRKKDDGLNMLV